MAEKGKFPMLIADSYRSPKSYGTSNLVSNLVPHHVYITKQMLKGNKQRIFEARMIFCFAQLREEKNIKAFAVVMVALSLLKLLLSWMAYRFLEKHITCSMCT